MRSAQPFLYIAWVRAPPFFFCNLGLPNHPFAAGRSTPTALPTPVKLADVAPLGVVTAARLNYHSIRKDESRPRGIQTGVVRKGGEEIKNMF